MLLMKVFPYITQICGHIPCIHSLHSCDCDRGKKDLNVCMRPWIRVNGSLNRRVLDKFLSSVLGHVMLVPLCSLRIVQERFSPAFQPHHTRELVEVFTQLNSLIILPKPGIHIIFTSLCSLKATQQIFSVAIQPNSSWHQLQPTLQAS